MDDETILQLISEYLESKNLLRSLKILKEEKEEIHRAKSTTPTGELVHNRSGSSLEEILRQSGYALNSLDNQPLEDEVNDLTLDDDEEQLNQAKSLHLFETNTINNFQVRHSTSDSVSIISSEDEAQEVANEEASWAEEDLGYIKIPTDESQMMFMSSDGEYEYEVPQNSTYENEYQFSDSVEYHNIDEEENPNFTESPVIEAVHKDIIDELNSDLNEKVKIGGHGAENSTNNRTSFHDLKEYWKNLESSSFSGKTKNDVAINNYTFQQEMQVSDQYSNKNEYLNYFSTEVENDEVPPPPPKEHTEDVFKLYDEFSTGFSEEVIEEQFDRYELPIIHVKNRTGLEEHKDFPIRLETVIAGRYKILEYLGSAAFSKAVRCIDLKTNEQVCVKIIKNNKEFFDQSLDEIKILKYINAHGDPDEHNVLRIFGLIFVYFTELLDYFYHKEHLFIVCELLRDNLYEFYKFNRESGDEFYFTIPRLKKITKQILIGLDFVHNLNLIHCDLKPENLLIKSYSKTMVKIIDFGSSCFTHDHLSSYVQSRSYRAPEVILGRHYDQRIDIWSLGCILAELWTGKVLFYNESLATLLAKVVGIIGPFPKEYLNQARHANKYFLRDGSIYEKTEYGLHMIIKPKDSSLENFLGGEDPMFVDFVSHLLTLEPTLRPTASEALKHPFLIEQEDFNQRLYFIQLPYKTITLNQKL